MPLNPKHFAIAAVGIFSRVAAHAQNAPDIGRPPAVIINNIFAIPADSMPAILLPHLLYKPKRNTI